MISKKKKKKDESLWYLNQDYSLFSFLSAQQSEDSTPYCCTPEYKTDSCPSSLPEGFFSQKEQDSRASNPAPSYLLLRLNSRWLLMRGGTPIYHPTPTHGMEVLLWMQSTKSTRILIMLAPACKIVVPCEESWAKRTLAAAHPPPPHWLLSCWSRGGHAERSLSLLPSLAPEPWLREFAWERIRSSNM